MLHVTRKVFLRSSLFGLAALSGYGTVVEPNRITVTHETVGTPRDGRRPFRLVQLSDLVAAEEDLLRTYAPRFMIAGHTHGGQITLFGFAPYVPRGSDGCRHGWYSGGFAPPMFVSRGLGTSEIPVRLMAPPEIVCFDWHLRRTMGEAA